MFRKIHSNRDPGTTIYQELKKEFGEYFERAGAWFQKIAANYPNQLFVFMVVALIFSAILSFTVFRNREVPFKKLTGKGSVITKQMPITDQFGRLMATASALQETIELKKQIEAILARGTLTARDSLTLNRALDRLRSIQKPIDLKP